MSEPRRIAILTTGRQDYGLLRSTILALRGDERFGALVWAGGMHLSDRFGGTLEAIRAEGVAVDRVLDFLGEAEDAVADTARAVEGVGRALEEERPDALLLVGDRSETLAAGVAATLVGVPVVHLHGGEETEGALDNACRHALTKLAHLHLVSHREHARRVVQMGEPREAVVIVGAPGLDNLYRDDLATRAELEERLGRALPAPLVLVTVHPTTLGGDARTEVSEVAAAMERVPATYVVTGPNADAGGEIIREFWIQWAEARDDAVVVDALGERLYWGLLRLTDAVLGNSSSGLVEAPAAGVPVVNVGDRQKGRRRYGRVVDVAPEADAVAAALRAALSGDVPAAPGEGYPSGPAAPRIVEALARWDVPRPPRKAFRDLPT